MAVSKIWKVTARLDQVIDYATNPEKTAAKEYSPEQYQALADGLQYAKDEEKTEREQRFKNAVAKAHIPPFFFKRCIRQRIDAREIDRGRLVFIDFDNR